MNLKSAIESLRTELRKFSTQKQSFADYKLADGTVVRVDGDLVAGTAVYVVAEDGTLPAPDGEHVVEGVGTIKTEGGKIVEVVAAAPVAETEVAAEVTPEVTEEVVETIVEEYPNVTPEKVEEIVEEKLLEISEELKEVVTEMRKVKSKMEAFALHMATMTDIVEKVSELPTEAPKASGSAIVEQRKAQASQNFNALAQALQSLKSVKN